MKFVVLDRDGTINKDDGYTHKVEDLEFLPGAIKGLKKFSDAGYKLIVVTNQAGIARNYYKEEDMHRFNLQMAKELENHNIKIESFYFCPHHPEFTGEYGCRKPNTFLVEKAAQEHGFEPDNCIFIGDKDSDIELGKNCQGLTVLIGNDKYENSIEPHYKAKNIEDAYDILAKEGVIEI